MLSITFQMPGIKMLQLETTSIFHPNVSHRTDPTVIHYVKFIRINYTDKLY